MSEVANEIQTWRTCQWQSSGFLTSLHVSCLILCADHPAQIKNDCSFNLIVFFCTLPHTPFLPQSLCCRALQRRCLGDDVCDAADGVGRGCVCVWVLQSCGLQSLSGRRERWGTQQHKQQFAKLVGLLWLSPNESTEEKNHWIEPIIFRNFFYYNFLITIE